jgi:polysaccharide biosynthesis protein PslH
MKILMLAHRLPYPPWTGDRVRAYHIARALGRRHQLTLACPLEGPRELPAARQLRRLIPDLEYVSLPPLRRRLAALAGLAGRQPLSVRYFASPVLAARLNERLRCERFDLVYVSSSSMAAYVPPGRVPVVMDFVDMDSDKWARYADETSAPLRWLYGLEARRLRRFEQEWAARARLSLVVTSVEARLLRQIAPQAPVAVVPNGVDTEYFHPNGHRKSEVPTLVFTGALDYFPNIDGVRYFSEAVLPLIRQRVPSARFLVVGRRPADSIRRLRRLAGIEVAADVPDVRPYMGEAHVAVVPLRIARGIQNKILEAMAMGLPVVTSPTPAQGIDADVGTQWFVEEGPETFAARVVDLLESPTERARVGRRARLFVEEQYGWARVLPRVDALVRAAAAGEVSSLDVIDISGNRAGTSGVRHA